MRLRAKHQEDIRLKIKGSQLINRLQAIAFNELKNDRTGEDIAVDMTSQVRAIEILLKKILSDQSRVEHTGSITLEQLIVQARAKVLPVTVDQKALPNDMTPLLPRNGERH